ncbi:MAG: hypothetical protein AABW56_03335 [Nanoarchaeota archaeon]
MGDKFKKFLRFISKSLGYLLINLSITLILFLTFTSYTLEDTQSLENDLTNYILETSNITRAEYDAIQNTCKSNPEIENCDYLLQNRVDKIKEQIDVFKTYLVGTIFVLISLILIGFLLVFLGTNNLIETGYRVFLALCIQSFFAALYYKLLPDILTTLINNNSFNNISGEVPREVVNEIVTLILVWLSSQLARTFKLALIVGVIFGIVTLIFYFVKKKRFKRE